MKTPYKRITFPTPRRRNKETSSQTKKIASETKSVKKETSSKNYSSLKKPLNKGLEKENLHHDDGNVHGINTKDKQMNNLINHRDESDCSGILDSDEISSDLLQNQKNIEGKSQKSLGIIKKKDENNIKDKIDVSKDNKIGWKKYKNKDKTNSTRKVENNKSINPINLENKKEKSNSVKKAETESEESFSIDSETYTQINPKIYQNIDKYLHKIIESREKEKNIVNKLLNKNKDKVHEKQDISLFERFLGLKIDQKDNKYTFCWDATVKGLRKYLLFELEEIDDGFTYQLLKYENVNLPETFTCIFTFDSDMLIRFMFNMYEILLSRIE